MSRRFALFRQGKGPAQPAVSGSLDRSWRRTLDGHEVRSEIAFANAGQGPLKRGDAAQHTLHVTVREWVFATEINGVGECRGTGFSYEGEGKTITRTHIAPEHELLVFDHPLDTDGTYHPASITETEQVRVDVSFRELGYNGQWERIVEFDLTLEVEV
jgi:hypothetical protein